MIRPGLRCSFVIGKAYDALSEGGDFIAIENLSSSRGPASAAIAYKQR